MFVKEIAPSYYAVFADEDFLIWLGMAEEEDGTWVFTPRKAWDGTKAIGYSLGEALRLSGVLEKVRAEHRMYARKYKGVVQ